jgi:hypothetical protein
MDPFSNLSRTKVKSESCEFVHHFHVNNVDGIIVRSQQKLSEPQATPLKLEFFVDHYFVHVDGLSAPLLLTPEHMLFRASSELGSIEAVRSDAIVVGDFVSVTQANATTRARVTSMGRTWQQGFVAPLTESGQIAVEGVVASCYADVTGHTHDVAHTAMKPLASQS